MDNAEWYYELNDHATRPGASEMFYQNQLNAQMRREIAMEREQAEREGITVEELRARKRSQS